MRISCYCNSNAPGCVFVDDPHNTLDWLVASRVRLVRGVRWHVLTRFSVRAFTPWDHWSFTKLFTIITKKWQLLFTKTVGRIHMVWDSMQVLKQKLLVNYEHATTMWCGVPDSFAVSPAHQVDRLHQARQGHQHCKSKKQHKCSDSRSEHGSLKSQVTKHTFSKNCPDLWRVHVPTSHGYGHSGNHMGEKVFGNTCKHLLMQIFLVGLHSSWPSVLPTSEAATAWCMHISRTMHHRSNKRLSI